jgi:site-specific DNA recombinase
VWRRRQWRRNPDSEKRERRYRLRNRSEWVEVAVPDRRIISDARWDDMRLQIECRGRPDTQVPAARQRRKKHLLSGLIRRSCCGSGYAICSKDYYRSAGHKERGTCANRLSVRMGVIEAATLAIFPHHLLTNEHAHLFADKFAREMARLTRVTSDHDRTFADRLAIVTREIEHLAANILSGIVNPTRAKLLSDREAEQAALEAKLAQQATTVPPGAVLPHPTLLRLFEKVGELRQALDAERVRGEAAEILAKLIDSVTVYPNGEHGPEAEVATPMQVALAWLLRRSPNILLIPGTSSVEHLRENMASGSLELGEDAMRRLDGIGVA